VDPQRRAGDPADGDGSSEHRPFEPTGGDSSIWAGIVPDAETWTFAVWGGVLIGW
jgi:hypothetical protein